MKKISKIFTILCALCLVFSFCFTACGGSKDRYADYNQVETLNEKTTKEVYDDIMGVINSNKTNFSSQISYDIDCSISDGHNSLQIEIQMQDIFKINGTNFYEKTVMDMGEMGGVSTSDFWYVDETAYMNDGQSKQKAYITVAQLEENGILDMDNLINPLYDFSAVPFDEVRFCINKNDATDIFFELTLDGADAEAFAENMLSKINMPGIDLGLDKVYYKFVINEQGEYSHSEIEFDLSMKMSHDGMTTTVKYTFDGEIRFSNLGSTVVTAPADADDYIPIN